MKKSSATSGSFRLPALTEEGILVKVVPYHPHKGDRTIWVLSYTKAAEDSSAVMDGPREPAHGHLDGQKGETKTEVLARTRRNILTGNSKNCSADVSLKVPVRFSKSRL